jgi:hypothetical protein
MNRRVDRDVRQLDPSPAVIAFHEKQSLLFVEFKPRIRIWWLRWIVPGHGDSRL